MGNARGKLMDEIGYGMGRNYRTGKYVKDCKQCGLVLAKFDRREGTKVHVCPRCGGET